MCRGGWGGHNELGQVCAVKEHYKSGAFDVKYLYGFSNQSVGAGKIKLGIHAMASLPMAPLHMNPE